MLVHAPFPLDLWFHRTNFPTFAKDDSVNPSSIRTSCTSRSCSPFLRKVPYCLWSPRETLAVQLSEGVTGGGETNSVQYGQEILRERTWDGREEEDLWG